MTGQERAALATWAAGYTGGFATVFVGMPGHVLVSRTTAMALGCAE